MLKYLGPIALFVGVALPALAEPYRLTIGDRVTVTSGFLEVPKTIGVDLDGNLRLPEIGSLFAAGKTLDQLEEDVVDQMKLGGFSGPSSVLVEIEAYAPVVVSGFVERSGKFDFLPGMDVGAALALAGGLGAGDIYGPNADVLAVNARRRAAAAAEQIAAAISDLAKYEAALAGPQVAIALSETLRAVVPIEVRTTMDARIKAERIQLDQIRDTTKLLVTSWNSDIADFQDQTVLLDERIVIKKEIIATLSADLADLETLRTQGLTTSSRFSNLQQQLSDDREELLNLETAKITARRQASLAARNRNQYLADQRKNNLTALEAARASLALGLSDHRFAVDELTVLKGGSATLEDAIALLDVSLTIRGPRADRFDGDVVDFETKLLPGDIVVVEVKDPVVSSN